MCHAWLKRQDFEQKSAKISLRRYLLRTPATILPQEKGVFSNPEQIAYQKPRR